MSDSVEAKPVVSGEMSVGSNGDQNKELINESKSVDEKADKAIDSIDDKVVDTEERMEVETSGDKGVDSIESDDQPIEEIDDKDKTDSKDKDDMGVAVDEVVGEEKSAQPMVEPMPDIKSPSDVSAQIEKPSSPAIPAVTPPHKSTNKKPKVDLTTVPVRQYLDTTVVPILLQGLSSLARERPPKPITFLANFLREKASEYDED